MKYRILLLYYSYIVEPVVYSFGSHEQFWKHYEKIKMLKKMQRLSKLEKELM
jgi:hypothetical protein